jgi:hypothetical protein
MKRHPSLQPLSRDHHEALLQVQMLRSAAPTIEGSHGCVSGICGKVGSVTISTWRNVGYRR